MRWRGRNLALWTGVLFAALGGAATAHAQVAPPAQATAEVRDASNRVLATASLREGRNEVLIAISFPSQPVLSGTRAIHINDTGRCDPPAFATSGNIFNPFNKKHGRQNPEGAEVGDLPNVNFSTGLTSYNTSAIGATLGSGPGSLLSPNRSLVIYSGQDDQQTPPDGNPGSPIGCGIIRAASASSAPSAVAVSRPASAASASPSPSASRVAVPVSAAPTPILILPTPVSLPVNTPSSQSSANALNPVLIGVVGLALIGAGVALSRTG